MEWKCISETNRGRLDPLDLLHVVRHEVRLALHQQWVPFGNSVRFNPVAVDKCGSGVNTLRTRSEAALYRLLKFDCLHAIVFRQDRTHLEVCSAHLPAELGRRNLLRRSTICPLHLLILSAVIEHGDGLHNILAVGALELNVVLQELALYI